MSRIALLLVFLILLPAYAAGQQEVFTMERGGELRSLADVDGSRILYLGGPVFFRGSRGTILQSDSAVVNQRTGTRTFVGNVEFRDQARVLTSDWLTHVGPRQFLRARGDVRYRDVDTGSTIRGGELDYQRSRSEGEEDRIMVRHGRPEAMLYRAEGEDSAEPLIVEADSIAVLGRTEFRGMGTVDFTRGDARGSSELASFNETSGILLLEENARVATDRFDVTGEWIRGETEGENLRTLVVREDAVLTGEEVTVEAPELSMFFDDGVLQRLVGVSMLTGSAGDAERPEGERTPAPRRELGEPPVAREEGGAAGEEMAVAGEEAAQRPAAPRDRQADAVETGPQVHAVAEGLDLLADSLEVLAPDQVVETLTAVGNAHAERIEAGEPPSGASPLTRNDWIRGDTITADFADGPDIVPGETPRPVDEEEATGERVLERVTASGVDQPASTLYRLAGEGTEDAVGDVNYLLATRIVLHLREGRVVEVDAAGPVEGLYLTRESSGTESGAEREAGS